ncbi:MAG: SpoVR family protein [Gammaproteobacteria bacterium]|nr:SpoVR family protein [Gammaproteobacteria bacterium]
MIKKRSNKPYTGNQFPDSNEWTFELIEAYHREIKRIAGEFGLNTYPVVLEIITSEQMMDSYSAVGMPLRYSHWSYGKQFLQTQQSYQRGQMGLAYEIVINSNPCIAYLMEENTMTMQALVIAHAAYGHNSFFKNNYLFKIWTSADSIIDYLLFSKNYISDCEERYGEETVELFLDSCHALMNHGVDRYKRPADINLQEEQIKQKEREDYLQSQVNEIWKTLPKKDDSEVKKQKKRFPEEPQENLLYFIEKNAPLLKPWQREVIRIVRKIAQYFYPQRQTQVMNEGWACFWHYTILNKMYDEGLVSDRFIMEFLHSHTNVVMQPDYDSQWYSGINPYALGFAMMMDIRRICEDPTDEDLHWFPDIANTDWKKTLNFAAQNFKDESFIAQYLSPKLIREFRFFSILDDDKKQELEVSAIHNDDGYQEIRQKLSRLYDLSFYEPNIQVYNVDLTGDRSLTLRHYQCNRKPLAKSTNEVMKHLKRLWGFPVRLETETEEGKVSLVCEITDSDQQK